MKQLRWAVVTLAAVGVLVGCGPKDANGDGIEDGVRPPDTVSLVAPSTPVGTVAGQLLTVRLTPLEGAVVTLSIPGRPDAEGNRAPLTATTGPDGSFFIPNVPAGVQAAVVGKKEGYAPLHAVVTVPSSAGNVPINDGNGQVGPFGLAELNGSVRFNIFTRSGRPAKNLKVTVIANPAAITVVSGWYGSPYGKVIAEGVVDANGQVSISGLPNFEDMVILNGQYQVIIPSFDENGDGVIDSAGDLLYYSGQSWIEDGAPRTITLQDARNTGGGLQVLATNVPSLHGSVQPSEGMVRPTDPLYFAFNDALLPGSIDVIVTNEASNEEVASVTPSLSSDGTVLTVANAAGWVEGREYNLLLRATSADTGEVYLRRAYFWAGDPNAPAPVTIERIEFDDTNADSLLTSGEYVYVHFKSPVVPVGSTENLYVYINADLNAAGGIGDAYGEMGAARGTPGFPLYASEPYGPEEIFAPVFSGYTGRWVFQYFTGGAIPNLSTGTNVSVDFSRLYNTGHGYYSMWGGLLTSNLSNPLQKAP